MSDEITLEKVKEDLRPLAEEFTHLWWVADLAWAVAEIERLQRIVAASYALHGSAMVQLSGLTTENAKFRKALEHYASRYNFANAAEVAEEALRDE